MPQIGPMEILVVGVIALIVFGPQKLPEIARSIGRAASELRRMASDVRDEFEAGINLEDKDEKQEETGPEDEGDKDEKQEETGPEDEGDKDEKQEETGPEDEGDEDDDEGGDPASRIDEPATSAAAQTNKVVGPAPTDESPSED
jgi:Tat protein translocase TatB subunit